jgi:hypothetical protein
MNGRANSLALQYATQDWDEWARKQEAEEAAAREVMARELERLVAGAAARGLRVSGRVGGKQLQVDLEDLQTWLEEE